MNKKLSREELEAQLAELQRQMGALQARLGTRQANVFGPGALALEGGTAAGEGGIAVGRDVLGSIFHVYQVAPGRGQLDEAEFEGVLNDYLGWVLREHGRARLHGLQSLQGTGAISRPLTDVYISLVARRRPAVMPGELPRREWWTMGREPDEMAEPQPVDMAELLTLGDRAAIVGGAGCGKTTYLSFVAASLAAALAGRPLDARLKPRRPGEPLPIPLVAPCGCGKRTGTPAPTGESASSTTPTLARWLASSCGTCATATRILRPLATSSTVCSRAGDA